MLVEIIFKGLYPDIDLKFLQEQLFNAKEVYFNYPEGNTSTSFVEVINTIRSEEYIDLVINTDTLNLRENIIPNVFINFGRDHEKADLLFFFNSDDLNGESDKKRFDNLKKWANEFRNYYSFNEVIGQAENSPKEEYFFHNEGYGKSYWDLIGPATE